MLLEALLGIAIFSIGIFALIAMQAVAIGNVSEAKYRTDATLLAGQIISTMWNDRGNLSDYEFDGDTAIPTKLEDWTDSLVEGLPGAGEVGTMPTIVMSTSGTTTEVLITVKWKTPKSDTVRQFQTVTYITPP